MVSLGPTEPYRPKVGDIGITTISDWGGKVIRGLQWLNGDGFADFEHAYVVTNVEDTAVPFIVEAMPGGAQHVENWHPNSVFLKCPEGLGELVAQAALECALKKIPYSDLDYVSIAAHRLHIPAPHLRKYIQSSGHMICSQLADYCALKGGWHLFKDHRWEGDVTPGDLYGLWREQQRMEV